VYAWLFKKIRGHMTLIPLQNVRFTASLAASRTINPLELFSMVLINYDL
jgi:hypothetical protein